MYVDDLFISDSHVLVPYRKVYHQVLTTQCGAEEESRVSSLRIRKVLSSRRSKES